MNYSKAFWSILLVLFVIFISILMASKSGYYEYENRNKKVFTEEKMKEFEEDVKLGKNIDIKNYLSEEEKDYTNKVTKIGDAASSLISNGISKGLEDSFKILEKFLN